MRSGKIVLYLFALLLFTASCNSDEPASPFKRKDVEPHSQLFATYEKNEGYVLWPGATINDSKLKGEGYDYGYYYQHRTEAKSFEEMMAMCQVPKSILKKMSTRNLVLTCFKHPYTFNYLLYDNEYAGVMSTMTANCYQELMRRRTGGAELLDLFCEMSYGDTILLRDGISLSTLEYGAVCICTMTALDCDVFDEEQIKQIANEIFDQIDGVIDYFDTTGENLSWMELSYPYLVGAVLAYHNDVVLQDYERDLLYKFFFYRAYPYISDKVSYSQEDVSRSTQIVTESLERLLQ